MKYLATTTLVVSLLMAASACWAAPLDGGVKVDRITAVASHLPDGTFSFGPKIADRDAWNKLASKPAFASVIPDAEKKLTEPMPAMTAEIFSLYKTTGERTKLYFDTRFNRHNRVGIYTLAECVENKGRFIKPLEDAIANICTEPTWSYNFHDDLFQDDWNGRRVNVDLGAILPAHDMATALVLLGDRLSPATRQLIVDNCRRRILEPYRRAVDTGSTGALFWINAPMNWNAVCHCGVVGTALAICDSKSERAFYIAAAEKFSADYLRGFGPDGYCAEGLGYWNYGFSSFIQLSEMIWQQTGGEVNLYDLPNARAAAMYPARIEIINGLVPSYADCELDLKPEPRLAAFVNSRYRFGVKQREMADLSTVSAWLPTTLMYSCPNSATAIAPADTTAGYELRSYFDHSGVLTCRPMLDSGCRIGVSIKGGINDGPHAHDDLGTFVVAVGKELLILDPGSEIYNSRTFGRTRYESKLINSFGHPVPVVAGKLQREGCEAYARILRADFTDAADTFAMDLTNAYDEPKLTKLTRTFTYTRTGQGSLVVVDDVSFSVAQTFAGALITFGEWKRHGDNSLVITQGTESIEVAIDAAGIPFDLVAETINEPMHRNDRPKRIGITLKQPIMTGKITLTIKSTTK